MVINPVGNAAEVAVDPLKCAEICEHPVLPPKGVAGKAVGVEAVWGERIGGSGFRLPDDHSATGKGSCWVLGSRRLGDQTCRPAERTQINKFVFSMLRGQWNRQRECGE